MHFFEKAELEEFISLLSMRYSLFSIRISCLFKAVYFYGRAIIQFYMK
jgi:hypothetical protein